MPQHEEEEAEEAVCEDDDNVDAKPRLCLLFIAEEGTLPPPPPSPPFPAIVSLISRPSRDDDLMTPVVVEVVVRRRL